MSPIGSSEPFFGRTSWLELRLPVLRAAQCDKAAAKHKGSSSAASEGSGTGVAVTAIIRVSPAANGFPVVVGPINQSVGLVYVDDLVNSRLAFPEEPAGMLSTIEYWVEG